MDNKITFEFIRRVLRTLCKKGPPREEKPPNMSQPGQVHEEGGRTIKCNDAVNMQNKWLIILNTRSIDRLVVLLVLYLAVQVKLTRSN